MRADRLLSIMLLLRSHGRMTAPEIAARLEVSPRTVMRDLEALSTAGVPVYADRGRNGGFNLLPGFRADVTDLDDVETQVLFAHLGLDTFGDLGLRREVRSALDKLAAATPERMRVPSARLRDVVHVDRRRWFAEPDDVTHLPALRRAAMERCRVRLTYRSPRANRATVRTLDPLGLVENGNRWYLVAYHRGEPRTWRLARIGRVSVLEQGARTPDDAQLADVWAALRSTFESRPPPPVRATVRCPVGVEEEVRGVLQTQVATGAEGIATRARSSDHVELEAEFRLPRSLVGMCLAFGGLVEILEPDDLRAAAREAARGALERHVDGPAAQPSLAPPGTDSG